MVERVKPGVEVTIKVELGRALFAKIRLDDLAKEHGGKNFNGHPDDKGEGGYGWNREWREYNFGSVEKLSSFLDALVERLKALDKPPEDRPEDQFYEIWIGGTIGGLVGPPVSGEGA